MIHIENWNRELAYDKKLENLQKYAMLILSMKN